MNSLLEFLSERQRKVFELFSGDNEGGIAFWKVGTGKTRIGLITCIMNRPPGSNMVAVVARRAAFHDWREEIATLQLDWETPQIEDIDSDTVFNIRSFILVSDGLLRKPSTIAALQYLIDKKWLGALIVDEGYLFSNPDSQRSIALFKIASQLPTVLLSGSIMPARDLTQIYGQAKAANKHQRIAPTLSKFRREFQKGIQGNFYAWYPKPGAYKAIMEKIAPFTDVYMPKNREREWHESVIKVPPSSEQVAAFKQLKEAWCTGPEGELELSNELQIIQHGQFISNGYLKGEGGNVTYIESTKINRTIALVQEILASDDKQVVIWCAYREDIRRLRYALDCEGGGKTNQIATLQSGDRFDIEGWKKKKYAICLATEDSGSSINHFAQVPYAIYFSQNFKWLSMQQSQGRHDRASSQHRDVYFYFLHTIKSPDARVHYTVKGAAAAERSFIAQFDVARWLGEI